MRRQLADKFDSELKELEEQCRAAKKAERDAIFKARLLNLLSALGLVGGVVAAIYVAGAIGGIPGFILLCSIPIAVKPILQAIARRNPDYLP